MTKKQPLPIYLDEYEREILEKLASKWGVSLSGAIKRLQARKRYELSIRIYRLVKTSTWVTSFHPPD